MSAAELTREQIEHVRPDEYYGLHGSWVVSAERLNILCDMALRCEQQARRIADLEKTNLSLQEAAELWNTRYRNEYLRSQDEQSRLGMEILVLEEQIAALAAKEPR